MSKSDKQVLSQEKEVWGRKDKIDRRAQIQKRDRRVHLTWLVLSRIKSEEYANKMEKIRLERVQKEKKDREEVKSIKKKWQKKFNILSLEEKIELMGKALEKNKNRLLIC